MDATTPPLEPSPARGRAYLWLGIATALLGVALYAGLVFGRRLLHVPYYMPALATFGFCLILLSLVRRPGAWRVVALLIIGSLAAAEWWWLLGLTRLPPYAGPVEKNAPFPAFEPASLGDGTPFTRAGLAGGKNTVVVFFRGFW
jgi:hypothetical protein